MERRKGKKGFCRGKETIDKVRRKCTEWEKLFAKHLSLSRGKYSKYTNNSYNSITKKPNNLI